MLTYTFDPQSKTCLYEHLYNCIKEDILSGKLKSGERLPSKRTLARHLKLSVITVENAYAQLAAEGYIYSIEKRGYYVDSIEEVSPAPVNHTSEITPFEEKKYFMDLKSNSISEENFPYLTLSRLMRTVISEQQGILNPIPYNGAKELRDAIADYLYHFRGMSVNSEQIIVGAGTEYLYNIIIQLLGRDKVYAVENPGYSKISKIYELNNIDFRHVDIDTHGLSINRLLERETQVVHISPSHHYPTGIVMPIRRRQELLRWANEKEGRYILEDDYDSEFRFTGRPIQPLLNIDTNGRVIYMNTFSKSIAPAIRVSYMILPPKLLEKYRKTMSFYTCSVPAFEQHMLAKFISGGHFEQHINRMKTLYRSKRNAVISAIQQSAFAKRATIMESHSGLHFLLRIVTRFSDREATERAANEGIRLAFLSEYIFGRDPGIEHVLVVNYSGIDIKKLPEAIRRLERVFEK